ncbi:TetR/AcrR family transcriptional regulator [Microbacterium sp. A196]|uniref:TetR/AcrR family transcriptional regulator n=1 Tax=unclassified Microbacterium TaxID=2609290 RepID=UPI003FD15061
MEETPARTTRRRRVQASHRELTRALLTDAAVRVFAEQGYVQTTVDQITEEAGTSRGTFYLHFHTKADILKDLLQRVEGEFGDPYPGLAQAFKIQDRDAVRHWILDAMQRWTDLEGLLRPVYEAADSDTAIQHMLFPDNLPDVTALSRALLDADVISDPQRADIYAIIFFPPLLHLFRKHLNAESFDHELAAQLMADAWMDIVDGIAGA